jgi:hypothetical protein
MASQMRKGTCKTVRRKGSSVKLCRLKNGKVRFRKSKTTRKRKARKGGRKCKFGVSKTTGKCLKRRRRR